MEFQPAEAKKFFSTVRKEMALLATSLPDGIMVKTFEDRMVGVVVIDAYVFGINVTFLEIIILTVKKYLL